MLGRLLRFGLPTLLVLSAIYGWLAYRYWTNPPKFSHNYAAELNAPVLKFPAEHRAWPVYREAIIELETDAPAEWRSIVSVRDIVTNTEAAAWLRERQHALAEFRRASRLPSLGHLLADQPTADDRRMQEASKRKSQREYEASRPPAQQPPPPKPPSENPQLMAVLLQPAGETGKLVLAMQADAVLAADAGDAERMTDDLAALAAFADQLREIPILVNDLRAAQHFSQALFTWGRLMEKHPDLFTDQRLRRLVAAAGAYSGGKLQPRFEAERFMFYDVVQRLYTDDGRGDGEFHVTDVQGTLEGGGADLSVKLIAPLTTWRFLSRRETVESYNRLVDLIEAESKRPLWDADFHESEALLRQYDSDRRYQLVTLFTPALKNVHGKLELVVQQRDAILAVAAAHRFRLEQGAWPETLDALVPKYLHEVPADRLVGKPLNYRILDGRPLLYSVGYDKQDDGGRAAIVPGSDARRPLATVDKPWHWSLSGSENDPPDGDFILWPVEPPEDAASWLPDEPAATSPP